jgi:hypothetical protein
MCANSDYGETEIPFCIVGRRLVLVHLPLHGNQPLCV